MVRTILTSGVCFTLLTVALASTAAPVKLSAVGSDQQGLADVVFEITSQTGATSASHTTSASMDQRDKQFAPHVLAVDTGSLVSFPNSDNIRHQVYSFSEAKKFELPLYHGKQAAPVLLDKPGIVVLGCNIHDNMIGYIVVSDAGWHAVSDSDGQASIDLPEGSYEVSVWHPLAIQNPATQTISVAPQGTTLSVQFGELKPDPRNMNAQNVDNPFRRRAFDAP